MRCFRVAPGAGFPRPNSLCPDPKCSKFLQDDRGAVTIDWVSLTAAILLAGIMVVFAIFNGGVSSLVVSISTTLASQVDLRDPGPAPTPSRGADPDARQAG